MPNGAESTRKTARGRKQRERGPNWAAGHAGAAPRARGCAIGAAGEDAAGEDAAVATGARPKSKTKVFVTARDARKRIARNLGDRARPTPSADPVEGASKTYRTNVWSQTHKIFRKLFIAFFFSQKARWPVRPIYRPVRPRGKARVEAARQATCPSGRESSLGTGSRGSESRETVFSRAEDFLKNLVSL